MRVRVRGPNGVSTLAFADTATVGDLKAQISSATALPAFDLKIGYPPKAWDLDAHDDALLLSDAGVKLDGEQLIATGRDVAAALRRPLRDLPSSAPAPVRQGSAAAPAAATKSSSASRQGRSSTAEAEDPPEVAVPELGGTLVLRVMPDDNSCLFRALAYAVLGDLDGMRELRALVAAAIQHDPDTYSAAVLERSPDDYCRWIGRDDAWGGAIELGILSQHFGVEVASVSVEDGRVDRFNEGAPQRAILVYSGIHYDCVALSPDFGGVGRQDPTEDRRVFDAGDSRPLAAALRLCDALRAGGYFTNTATFTTLCNVCGWRGRGEREAVRHAVASGHGDFAQA